MAAVTQASDSNLRRVIAAQNHLPMSDLLLLRVEAKSALHSALRWLVPLWIDPGAGSVSPEVLPPIVPPLSLVACIADPARASPVVGVGVRSVVPSRDGGEPCVRLPLLFIYDRTRMPGCVPLPGFFRAGVCGGRSRRR